MGFLVHDVDPDIRGFFGFGHVFAAYFLSARYPTVDRVFAVFERSSNDWCKWLVYSYSSLYKIIDGTLFASQHIPSEDTVMSGTSLGSAI